MPYFERFDICEAYLVLEWDYNVGGWLRERPSNRRRSESTAVQLSRMNFHISPAHRGYASLSENAREIYALLRKRYGFRSSAPSCSRCAADEHNRCGGPESGCGCAADGHE